LPNFWGLDLPEEGEVAHPLPGHAVSDQARTAG
jgi:hypothetical protein